MSPRDQVFSRIRRLQSTNQVIEVFFGMDPQHIYINFLLVGGIILEAASLIINTSVNLKDHDS